MCLFVIASQADSCDKSTEKNGIVEMEQEKGAEKDTGLASKGEKQNYFPSSAMHACTAEFQEFFQTDNSWLIIDYI